ncbi:MAG: 30S ribosomal protein S4 [archaeon]|nr:30S ribosomal protein S4 [archaeon]
MIRKHNSYVRPKKAFEKSRIKEENVLMKKYGLKNKVEIWKTIAKVDYFRRRAKALARASSEEQQIFFDKLKKIGLKITGLSDVLELKVEDLLERRLPTIIFQKKLVDTIKHSRQLVTHKKVLVNGKIINIPSYIVSVEEENSIKLKNSKVKSIKPVAAQVGGQENG